MTIPIPVFIGIIGFLVVAYFAREAWKGISRVLNNLTGAIAEHRMAAAEFQEAAGDLAKVMAGIPKIMEGVTKACGVVAQSTVEHRESVRELSKLFLQSSDPKDALQTTTDESASKRYEVMRYIAQGKHPDEAEQLAEADAQKTESGYSIE